MVVGISVASLVKNENKEVKRLINSDTRKIETYDPDSRGLRRMSEKSMERKKSKEQNKILMIGGGVLAVFVIGFLIIKSNENKKDPIKNLETLKMKNIISQSEFKEKIKQSKEIENENRKKKESKKLVAELDNLKAKGILTEQEYQQKLIKIQEKTA